MERRGFEARIYAVKEGEVEMTDPRDYEVEHIHGGMSRWAYLDDPKRLAFTLARYKHTAKLLEGFDRVLEVGCGDGFGARIVRQHVHQLVAIDTDPRSIGEARYASSDRWPIYFFTGSITTMFGPGRTSVQEVALKSMPYDAVYALDVLEHISPDDEFLAAMAAAAPVAVIGTPSLESQQYASPTSKLGHINCYSGGPLRTRLLEFWHHVFIFTMHDEGLGTSFLPMAHYLLALCVEPRVEPRR